MRIAGKIAHFANTIIGRPGNIGVRTSKIIARHAQQGGTGHCVCRLTDLREQGYQYHDMGWLGHLPRLLNAANIYLNPSFDHRKWDLKLFEHQCARHLDRILADNIQVAHVWEVCVHTLRHLRRHSVPIVLDVPVAPFHYVRRLHAAGKGQGLNFFQRQMDIEDEAFALADLLIAPSSFVASELELSGVPAEKIRVVEFGTHLPEDARQAAGDKVGIDFALVGNVSQRKGAAELLNVWSDPDFAPDRLHLCGRMTPGVARQIQTMQFSNVLAPGFIKPFEYLQSCDVFVFPSWSEGSAKAIYEAMACGLPVITTHSAGSVVRHGVDGFIIDAGDHEALRDRLKWFKQNPEQIETMGASARAHAKTFTWSRYAESVINIYNECAS
jgi:glycosyltransferase involved in cell wall biosynthesis